jgi:hypothetical protein
VAVLLGCGGRAASTAPHSDLGAPCVTSTGCAKGLRCDAGLCAADEACPAAQGPTLLFELPSTSPFASGFPYVVFISDHELLVSQMIADPTATSLAFYDLHTGQESALPHESGVAYCGLDPAVCFSTNDSATSLFEGLSLDPATSTWSAAGERTFTVDGTPFFSSGDLAAGRLPFWSSTESSLSVLDIDTGGATLTLALEGSPLAAIADAHGVTTSLNTILSDAAGVIIKNAPLREGATFDTIYSGEAVRSTAVLLTNGSPRYSVRENGATESATIRVERVVDAVPTTLGTLTDPPLSAVSFEYASRPLEPSSSMYALDCRSAQKCRSFLIHLDPVSAELIAEASWPDGNLPYVSGIRRLACGARDLVLATVDPASQSRRFWSVRLTGREGLP